MSRPSRKKAQQQNRMLQYGAIGVIALVVLFFVVRSLIPGDDGGNAPDTSGIPAYDPADLTTTASGLQYLDLEQGDGVAAQPGDTVSVHYTGWLTDGTKFDSSVDKGTPFEFVLGQGRVIDGWDEGVAGMQVGGRRLLVIPAELGYGDTGAGGGLIPGGATLVFEVQLLEIK